MEDFVRIANPALVCIFGILIKSNLLLPLEEPFFDLIRYKLHKSSAQGLLL